MKRSCLALITHTNFVAHPAVEYHVMDYLVLYYGNHRTLHAVQIQTRKCHAQAAQGLDLSTNCIHKLFYFTLYLRFDSALDSYEEQEF